MEVVKWNVMPPLKLMSKKKGGGLEGGKKQEESQGKIVGIV